MTPTLLEAFEIDRFEVTNAQFAEFLRANGLPPLPDECGMQEGAPEQGFVVELSGWIGGMPPPDRLDHPVVCVSRTEAIEFCAQRGGRLVSAFEYMRAARGPAPDRRLFPWGDAPPAIGTHAPWPELPTDWHLDYATLGAFDATNVQTRAVDAAVLGVSADEVHGLAGNVSELVAECAEDVFTIQSAPPAELIRPTRPAVPTCNPDFGQLVAGSNWRSSLHRDAFGAAIFVWNRHFAGITSDVAAPDVVGTALREPLQLPAPVEDRSWRVGFRCAYDLHPSE